MAGNGKRECAIWGEAPEERDTFWGVESIPLHSWELYQLLQSSLVPLLIITSPIATSIVWMHPVKWCTFFSRIHPDTSAHQLPLRMYVYIHLALIRLLCWFSPALNHFRFLQLMCKNSALTCPLASFPSKKAFEGRDHMLCYFFFSNSTVSYNAALFLGISHNSQHSAGPVVHWYSSARADRPRQIRSERRDDLKRFTEGSRI